MWALNLKKKAKKKAQSFTNSQWALNLERHNYKMINFQSVGLNLEKQMSNLF